MLTIGGLVLAAYLLVATGVPDDPTPQHTTCADRVVHHAARLGDC